MDKCQVFFSSEVHGVCFLSCMRKSVDIFIFDLKDDLAGYNILGSNFKDL